MDGRIRQFLKRPRTIAFSLILVTSLLIITVTALNKDHLSTLVYCMQVNTSDQRQDSHVDVKIKQYPIVSQGVDSIAEKTEVRHIAFLKVHKAGSTTAQNIFLRFGWTRHLTFLLASKIHNECGGYQNCISYYNTLTDKNTYPPPQNKTFDIMCSHVLYNRESFRKFLPADTVNVGVVREPIKRLSSAINFFQLLKNIDFSAYANDPARYAHAMINNRMAYEFGFRLEWLPVTSNKTLTSTERDEISEYINQLDRDFALIIVMERFHESLVLLKRILHWTTKDILYSSQRTKEHRKFEDKDKTKLKRYLYLDYMLYELAVKKLEQKLASVGEDFYAEVKNFDDVNTRVNMYCNGMKTKSKTIEASGWYEKFTINKDFCTILRMNEFSFLEQIRHRQYQ